MARETVLKIENLDISAVKTEDCGACLILSLNSPDPAMPYVTVVSYIEEGEDEGKHAILERAIDSLRGRTCRVIIEVVE